MSQKPMTEIEEHVREVLSTAREEGRREIDRCILANAISVIDKERERANAAEKKLEALAEAAEGVFKYREVDTYLGAWGTLRDAIKAARGES